jgi:hypothetical protein
VRVPEQADLSKANVKLSFEAWKAVKVSHWAGEVPVAEEAASK